MNFSDLRWGEVLAAVGGVFLVVSVFLKKTYEARPENPNAMIEGLRGTVSIWDVHPILRVLLIAAALAPIILLYIIVRGHTLSWPRTMM
jgi:hypothetical protein